MKRSLALTALSLLVTAVVFIPYRAEAGNESRVELKPVVAPLRICKTNAIPAHNATLATLTTPARHPVVTDCDVVATVCRDVSQSLYTLCVGLGGNASDCAWQEALNTIKCMRDQGCDPTKAPTTKPPNN